MLLRGLNSCINNFICHSFQNVRMVVDFCKSARVVEGKLFKKNDGTSFRHPIFNFIAMQKVTIIIKYSRRWKPFRV